MHDHSPIKSKSRKSFGMSPRSRGSGSACSDDIRKSQKQFVQLVKPIEQNKKYEKTLLKESNAIGIRKKSSLTHSTIMTNMCTEIANTEIL
jgi:hypothetical protein